VRGGEGGGAAGRIGMECCARRGCCVTDPVGQSRSSVCVCVF
jgi:hypothetical protein